MGSIVSIPHEVTSEECMDALECPICRDSFRWHERGVAAIQCAHIFHQACLEQWAQTQRQRRTDPTCPLCRARLRFWAGTNQ
jgi:C4-type Zn-finger protein